MMVGFDPKNQKSLTPFEYGMAGAFSGGMTRMIGQPLDVLKIRFQLQIEPIRKTCSYAKYRGILQAVNLIVKEESILGLWKGHISAQVLSVVYGGVEFSTFEYVTKVSNPIVPEIMSTGSLKPVLHFISGGIAGCAATVVCQPFDVLRTRFVAQGEPKIYKSYIQACLSMYKHEGVTSFYKGLVPTLLQIAPYAGLQFGFYSLLRFIWDKVLERLLTSFYFKDSLESLLCGSAAGMFAKLAVYPLDLTKKRLQVQGFEAARHSFGETAKYRGLTHCMLTIIHHEGLRGLYKGVTPSMLKASIMTGIHFALYERTCHLLKLRHKER